MCFISAQTKHSNHFQQLRNLSDQVINQDHQGDQQSQQSTLPNFQQSINEVWTSYRETTSHCLTKTCENSFKNV